LVVVVDVGIDPGPFSSFSAALLVRLPQSPAAAAAACRAPSGIEASNGLAIDAWLAAAAVAAAAAAAAAALLPPPPLLPLPLLLLPPSFRAWDAKIKKEEDADESRKQRRVR
jgi:hypothetical protein